MISQFSALFIFFCDFQILKRDQPIAPLDWVAMARQVAEGMNFLHKNKVVHRDLKSPKYDECSLVLG